METYNTPTPHSPHWYENQILSMMTNSDIGIMMSEKIKEKKFWENQQSLYNKKYDLRKLNKLEKLLIKSFYEKEINQAEKEINKWRFIFNERTGKWNWKKVDLDKYKQQIPLLEVMRLYWVRVNTEKRNIKCPFPFHKDKTASFKIYWNRFICFGCHSKWSQIDFIKYITETNDKEATKKFIEIWKHYFND